MNDKDAVDALEEYLLSQDSHAKPPPQFLDELELPDPGDAMMSPPKRQKPVVAALPAEDNQDVVGITEAQMAFVTQACLAQTGNVYKTLPVSFFKTKLIDLGIEFLAWAADQAPNPETCRSHWRVL
eukprot:2468955-Amphidinium_carterae.1